MKDSGAVALAKIEALTWIEGLRAGEAVDDGAGGFIRNDLLVEFVMMTVRRRDQRELLDLFEDWISPTHHRLLRLAMAAKNLRDVGRAREADRLVDDATHRFGPDAAKIRSLYSAQYIEGPFLFQRMWMAFESQGPGNAERLFREWFEDQLKFFDRAIFVWAEMRKKEIEEGLTKRLLNVRPAQAEVSVWAAGISAIGIAEKAIDSWLGRHEDFDYGCLPTRQGRTPGYRFLVYNKKRRPDFKPSRLPLDWDMENA